jgi:hypothetical protein
MRFAIRWKNDVPVYCTKTTVHVVHEIVHVCMVQDWDRDQSGSILLSLVGPSTVERSDHPARTGGRSCQQVGSTLPVAPSTVERSDHPARTGGRSCQQVGSSLAVGSSPVDCTNR